MKTLLRKVAPEVWMIAAVCVWLTVLAVVVAAVS